MVSTDLDVLEKFHAIVGLGRLFGPYNTKSGRKPQFMWKVQDLQGFRDFVALILPHLCSRRRERALEILKLRDDYEASPPATYGPARKLKAI